MSIKLYHALRWERDPADLIGLAQHVRQVAVDTHRGLYQQLVAACAVSMTSAALERGEPGLPLGLLTAAREVDRVLVAAQASPYRTGGVDLSCQIGFFVDPEPSGSIYGIVFADNATLRDALVATGDNYEYWNNTDRPKDCSEADWAERRAVWSRILREFSATPADVGVFVNVDHGAVGWDVVTTANEQMRTILDAELAKFAAASTGVVPTVAQITACAKTDR